MVPERDDVELERHGWRLDALDQWRTRVDRRLDTLEGRVSELVVNDELAARLTDELRRRGTARFTRAEKTAGGLAAAVVALCALGSFVLQALQTAGHP